MFTIDVMKNQELSVVCREMSRCDINPERGSVRKFRLTRDVPQTVDGRQSLWF